MLETLGHRGLGLPAALGQLGSIPGLRVSQGTLDGGCWDASLDATGLSGFAGAWGAWLLWIGGDACIHTRARTHTRGCQGVPGVPPHRAPGAQGGGAYLGAPPHPSPPAPRSQ